MSIHDASSILRLYVFKTKIWHPICHQIAQHESWEVFDQTHLDDFSLRIFANFEVVRFKSLFCVIFYLILGASSRTQGASSETRGSIWRQLGSPGTILCWSDFSRNPKIIKNWLLMFPVTVFNENRRNRCGIDARSFSNHPFISKTPDLPPQRPLCE